MPDLSNLVTEFTNQRDFHTEGDSGVESLNNLAEALGYESHGFKYGSHLEVFLSDNPGAMEAIVNWIGKQRIPEWIENLESSLPEKEDDSDDEDVE